jgi:hypothetical protein
MTPNARYLDGCKLPLTLLDKAVYVEDSARLYRGQNFCGGSLCDWEVGMPGSEARS